MTLFDARDEGPAKVKLVVAYDGTGFRGFAPQPSHRTVGGVLTATIEKVLQHDVELVCAGRTDAGVHAWGQVVSFEAQPGLDPWRLQNSINSMLAPEVVVRSSELVAPSFDARHSAEWRQYRYTIVNRPVPDPFQDRFSWYVAEKLDLRALRLAADPFIGEHDFASFCRKKEGVTTTRRVVRSQWQIEDDGLLRYEIRAHAFCQQMVRSIVGTLVDVGVGRRRPGDVLGIIRAGDRNAVGNIAPPHGLCLWEVGYV
ncbi:MAG: tRNA pseudouridine(38-40) synthase [Actinomycetia bacterium]|jgi:tRNA pseudouridine38-40 synthase|nr:tRNA pseudouridine(38-40) synthase [Actinomycetes bacterium]